MPLLLPIALGIAAIVTAGAGAAYVGNTAVNNWTNPNPPPSFDPNAAFTSAEDTALYIALGLGALYLFTRED